MSQPTDALQAALQGEYASIFGYGQAAGRLTGSQLALARIDLDAHRGRRDRLRALVVDASATPTAAAPEYLLGDVRTAAAARDALAGIEMRLAATYADLVAASTGPVRTLAITALQESTIRAARL